MVEELDAAAILAHLNEMGYCNITTYQLKEFIKDLRKLMKYENKKIKESLEQFVIEKSSRLSHTPTISSQAKSVPKYNTPKFTTAQTKCKLNDKQLENTQNQLKNNSVQPNKCPLLTKTSENICKKSKERIKRECRSAPSKIKMSEKSSKKIVTQAPSKPFVKKARTDPVSLYHQYKQEWDRCKIPGENKHQELRWSIRRSMLG